MFWEEFSKIPVKTDVKTDVKTERQSLFVRYRRIYDPNDEITLKRFNLNNRFKYLMKFWYF